MKTLIPAVAYVRMSTDRQDDSPRQQREEIEKLAKDRYRIVRWYQDDGISGSESAKREAFRRLIADASEKPDFQVILCWDQDRFSRFDPVEANYYWHILREASVKIVTVAQGELDFDDLGGWLCASVNQYGKHQFLRDLARNSLRGLIARVKQGQWPGGRAPFGYELGDDGKLKFGDQAKVKAVRRVFALRATGLGYRGIARELNREAVVSPSGGNWSHDAVRLVLTREAYLGVVTIGATSQGKYFTTNGGDVAAVERKRGRAKPLRMEHCHPAMITLQQWNAAKAVKAKPFSRKAGEGAPLAGLVNCACCGRTMYSQSRQKASGQKHPNYICSTYHKGRGCGYCAVPQGALLKAVATLIRDKILLGSRDALEEAVARELDKRMSVDGTAQRAEHLREQLAKLDNQIDRAADRLLTVDDSLAGKVAEKLNTMKFKRDGIAAELDLLKPSKRPKMDAGRIAAQIWELDNVLAKGSPRAVRTALSRIIDRIDLRFVEGKRHGRGQSYKFAGGTVHLCSKQCAYPMRVR